MIDVVCPDNILEEIEVGDLLSRVMQMKRENYRLAQICAAYINEKIELSYSFADDLSYEFYTLRIIIDPDTVVPSITEIVPHALFHENEMKELFGVKVKMISLDYNNKLYRINEETPFLPKTEGGQ